MQLINKIHNDILHTLQTIIGKKVVLSVGDLSEPPKAEMGDVAFGCFRLSSLYKKSSAEVAQKLAETISEQISVISKKTMIHRVESAGPYLNFFLYKEKVAQSVLKEVASKKEKYGQLDVDKGQTVMVEYVSPNTNKPLHLGHIRNATLGWSVGKILEKTGYKVVKTSIINDRGIHICKSMLAYQKFKKKVKTKGVKSDHVVGGYYVLFEKELKENPDLLKEAQEMLRKWEAGDKKVQALWKKMNTWTIKGHNETYKKLKVSFDKEYLESDLYKHGKEIVNEGLKKEVFKKEEGAVMVDLEKYNFPNKILQRSDGTALYMTQDLYLAEKKFEDYKMDKSIIVVGSEQDLHFKQLFKILELLGHKWAPDCYHLSYGMVFLPEGKMKSREGTVVDADNLIANLAEMAKKELRERHKKITVKELETRAAQIALAAIKYYLAQVDPKSSMHFDPKKSLSFEGRTGPYLQYAIARIGSILRKAGRVDAKKVDYNLLTGEKEHSLVMSLIKYPEIIKESAKTYNPSMLAKYLFELAQVFNDYYHEVPVLKADKKVRKVRLQLLVAIKIVLEDGLELLGIEAPDRM